MRHAVVRKLPQNTISRLKDAILGRDFELSVAYVSARVMRRISNARRKHDAATDILSFPLSKTSGEILICLPEVETHARAWRTTPARYLPYLFIHGLLHLKGYTHGRIMDALESRYTQRFNIQKPDGTTGRSRHRRRNVPSTRRRRTR